MNKHIRKPTGDEQKLLDQLFTGIIKPMIEGGRVGLPISVADLIWKGAYLVKTELTFDIDSNDAELLETVRSRDPEKLKLLVWKRNAENKESLEDLRKAGEIAKTFLEKPRKYRKLLKALVDEHISPTPAGRDKKISTEQLPSLATLSEQLFPAVEKFLAVREVMPKRTAEELLDFLSKDFPNQSEYIKSRVSLLCQLLSNDRLFISAKGTRARARLMSDALAGDNWHMMPSYSIKQAKTARRLAKRT